MSDDSYLSDDDIPVLVNVDQSSQLEETIRLTQDVNKTDDCEYDEHLPPVPVTILTGFLGSGKTTLIQYILSSPDHKKKIAVIENEFSGASAADKHGSLAEKEGLNIETLIARDGTKNNDNLIDLIELPNGCICCTVKDSLVETLEALISQKRELDYIIIEASGMANPGPIASIFWLDDALESRLRLDGIVACVDARNINMQLIETSSKQKVGGGDMLGGDEAAQQIAFADRIIVNKIDLLTKESTLKDGCKNVEEVVAVIRSINKTAPIRTTTFSQIQNLSWILDANCFSAEKAEDVEAFFDGTKEIVKAFVDQRKATVNYPFCPPCVTSHNHTEAIKTIALIEIGSVCLKKVNTWLAHILWPDQDKEDSILSKELRELANLGTITTPEIIERRRREAIYGKMLIFRIKGIISSHYQDLEDINDGDEEYINKNGVDGRKYIVQAVNDLWEIKPSNSTVWEVEERRICKLVFIGRNLDSEVLTSGFKECFRSL